MQMQDTLKITSSSVLGSPCYICKVKLIDLIQQINYGTDLLNYILRKLASYPLGPTTAYPTHQTPPGQQ